MASKTDKGRLCSRLRRCRASSVNALFYRDFVQPTKRADATLPVKTIRLGETGGTLTLSGTFSPLELDGEAGKLIYDIVDLTKRYEQQAKKAAD
jgi:hypothetical protein